MKYHSKSIIIEAKQINFDDSKNLLEIEKWIAKLQSEDNYAKRVSDIRRKIDSFGGYPIQTFDNNILIAKDGDYIIYDSNGKLYTCNYYSFGKIFEQVTE